MESDRIRYRLTSTESQTSVNTDTYLKIILEGNERLLPSNDLNRTVSSAKVFNDERQACTRYRILGTIKPIVSNVLFNINLPLTITNQNGLVEKYGQSWRVFGNNDFIYDYLNNPDTTRITGLTFSQSYKENLKEKDGWLGFYDPALIVTGQCLFNYMEPVPSRFAFIPETPDADKNWELTITYPFSSYTNNYIVSDTIIGENGLKIIGFEEVTVGGRPLAAFSTPVKHNLKQGDKVKLINLQVANVTLDGTYTVVRTGLDNGSNKEYYFCVEIETPLPGNINLSQSRMRRVVKGKESEYYLRLFKRITTTNININNGIVENDDYEMYHTAFSKTIFNDEVAQFVFNEDIDVSSIVDNLNRPISEIYLTVVKKHDESFFTPVKSGVECGLVEGIRNNIEIPDIRQIYDDNNFTATPTSIPSFQSPTPLDLNVNINDQYFYGDVVEYNKYELLEHVLAPVAHRFNTIDRTTEGNVFKPRVKGPRHEGYFYYPHQRMHIRDFSSYIEQGDANTLGLPDYAEDLGDGRLIWRDLLDVGVNDGQLNTVNYPYLNNSHYLYQNYCFPVRRQDPYGQYGLLYYGSGAFEPFDILGVGITDKFDVNFQEDAC